MGSFEVELYVKHAPRTCKNFLELAKRGYYNGTIVSPAPPQSLCSTSEGLQYCTASNFPNLISDHACRTGTSNH